MIFISDLNDAQKLSEESLEIIKYLSSILGEKDQILLSNLLNDVSETSFRGGYLYALEQEGYTNE